MVLTMALVILYAFSDEFHQSYVPSRSASIGDVTIDSCGGLCGALWMNLYLTHSRRLHRPIQKT
jgi:VanZ family protein